MPQIGVFSARDAEKLLGTVCDQVRDLAVDREAALSGMECDLFALCFQIQHLFDADPAVGVFECIIEKIRGVCEFMQQTGEACRKLLIGEGLGKEACRMYRKKLKETAEREMRMKYTVVGAHRDDISFLINNMPAKDYASQGQIRSIAVALKLAEAEMIYNRSEDIPIVILDDVLSELDEFRRSFIINHIDNFQIFITSCNLSDTEKFGHGKIWEVNGGRFELKEG